MSKLIYALLACAIAGQVAMHYPDLPERVASHYDGAGTPNDFMTKAGLIGLYAFVAVVVFGVFAAVPWMLRTFPVSLINLPNREYWLAPERREATSARAGVLMDVFADATGALLISVFEMTFRANESASGRMSPPGLLLGAYFAFVAGWLFFFYRSFAKPA